VDDDGWMDGWMDGTEGYDNVRGVMLMQIQVVGTGGGGGVAQSRVSREGGASPHAESWGELNRLL